MQAPMQTKAKMKMETRLKKVLSNQSNINVSVVQQECVGGKWKDHTKMKGT